MQIKYFQDTDTLLLNFNDNEIQDTKDIYENLLVELDKNGNIVSMTLEYDKNYANIHYLSFQQLVAV